MMNGRRWVALLAATTVAAAGATTASAAPLRGKDVVRTVRAATEKLPVRSTLFGVWVDGRPLATGALGIARPGVRATKAAHFRIGNTTESFTTTLYP